MLCRSRHLTDEPERLIMHGASLLWAVATCAIVTEGVMLPGR